MSVGQCVLWQVVHGFQLGLLSRYWMEVFERRSNFEVAWNCNWVETLDPSKDNRYEVNPCRTFAYRSFQSTVGL